MTGLDILASLAARRQELLKSLETITDEMQALITKLPADTAQVDIVKASGYTRETIRKLRMTPEQAETERLLRRDRERKAKPKAKR